MRNLKKVIALVAVFAMMVSTVAFAQTFSDVKDGDSYYEAIETLNKLGILTGDDEDNDGVMDYRPEDTITRAEITVIVARIQGQTGASGQSNTVFTDVPATHWASGYVAMATNQGIINGYGDGMFGPDDKVKYEDVVKMLMETLGYKPYAATNGGYPTGYILAAQKQGVLKNVAGVVEGTEATRGQVAQMTYNAIDTPLMDRYVFGSSQEQYVVWDGESWSPRKTLMNQNLGIQKLRGIVTENNITAIDGSISIDTSSDAKIRLDVKDNYLGSNDTTGDYEIDTAYYLYTGDTAANDYLGYEVVVYVQDDKNETDTILSITEATGKNTKVDFTISQYDSLDVATSNNDYLCYMKNDTDKNATKLKLQEGAEIIYNGRYYDGKLSAMFGGIIEIDSALSGRITVLDNDDISGYDVIFVDVATSAVVDELTNRGVVTFKEAAGDRTTMNSFNKIEFDSSNTDQIINITKDGVAYDYTDLKSWDVISVVARTDASDKYFDIQVLGDTAITGKVSRTFSSDTSANGVAYTIDGVDYDIALGYYYNGSLKAGAEGTFYIDQFGKIVAYNKDGVSSTTHDNYGYIIDAQLDSAGFSGEVPSFQILYKDGNVNTWSFYSTVTIENPNDEIRALASKDADDTSVSYKYKEYTGPQNEAAMESLVGQIVTFNSDANGYIKNLTVATTSKANEDSELVMQNEGAGSYDSETEQFKFNGSKKYDVTDETLIFYIGKEGTSFSYGDAPGDNSSEDCEIGLGSALNTLDAKAVAYTNGNMTGALDVLVIYNKNAGMDNREGVAYITSIGSATVDGTKVLSVQYYQDGELIEKLTDSTMVGTLTDDTVPGSLYKFGFTNDVITSAKAYLTFNGTVRNKLTNGDNIQTAGTPNVDFISTGTTDEEIYYGAVVNKKNNRLTIARAEAGKLPDLALTETFSPNNYTVNYYTYDPARSGKSKFALGSMGDVISEKLLSNDNGNEDGPIYDITVNLSNGSAKGETAAWGMLDYVFVRTYERVADVVDYMAWEYDYDFEVK